MKKIATIIICSFLMFSSGFVLFDVGDKADGMAVIQDMPSYVIHAPIKIESNADFISQGWPGSGISSDPWRIEGLNITGVSFGCICIQNTTDYFKIQNNYLHNASGAPYNAWNQISGIVLVNAENGTIVDNVIRSNTYHGIITSESYNLHIENNTISFNGMYGTFITGHQILAVDNCTLFDNRILNNTNGMRIVSSGNQINNNNISYNSGIGVSFLGISNYFENNVLYYNGNRDISLLQTRNNQLINNTIFASTYGGIFISGYLQTFWNTHNIDTTNTVNSRPIQYWKNETSGTIPSGAGQVILANCTNVVVENQNISQVDPGFQIGYSNNNYIANNTASGGLFGFWVIGSGQNSFENNTAFLNEYGFYFKYSDDNHVVNNNVYNNTDGFYLTASDDNSITNNHAFSNNNCGLWISTTSKYNKADNNNLSNNAIGIYLDDVEDNYIELNNVTNNTNNGIELFDANINSISANILYQNNNYGAYIESSVSNLLFHNQFINNVNQAYDESSGSNQWDNGYPYGGNYWSDYVGIDNNQGISQDQPGNDGIGDTNYVNIDGGTNVDNYPLMPMISHSPYIELNSPANNSLIVNGTLIDLEIWDRSYDIIEVNYSKNGSSNIILNSPYDINTTAWSDGTYKVDIFAMDNDGHTAFKSFQFTIDSTRPISAVIAQSLYWQNAKPVVVNVNASDSGGSLADITLWYRYSEDNSTWNNWTSYSSETSIPWSWDFDYPCDDGYYEFYSIANDTVGNTELPPSNTDTSLAYDQKPPEITDNSLSNATTGERLILQTQVLDNLGLKEINLIYWFGTGSSTNISMAQGIGDNYSYNIQIPQNSTDELHYYFVGADYACNWNISALKEVQIIDNDNPVADAGANQTVDSGTIVTFNGTNSIDNIVITNYTWTFYYGGVQKGLFDSATQFNFSISGEYAISLNVRDEAGNLDSDTVLIIVVELPVDSDKDGVPDADDPDDDNDGTPDTDDAFPLDETEDTDTDGDGIGNNGDTDDDGDGWNDTIEVQAGTDPLNSTDEPVDEDGNGIPDNLEELETGSGNIWLYILIILVVAGVMVGVLFLRVTSKSGVLKEPVEESTEEPKTEAELEIEDGEINHQNE